ncbi:MAG TPA: hypothetical protein VLT90_12625 [Terriglobales bacterium]|nr:hypothetical protein [Terriglobales bacterium]
MHRSGTGFFLIFIALVSLAVLSGCVGKGTSTEPGTGVLTVTLAPATNVSLELGSTQNFTASARNGSGGAVIGVVQYKSDNNASLTISSGGVACAGAWNSLSNPTVCTPGVAGIANVTAVINGVSSAPTTVYVHQHIQNIQITPVDIPTDPCFSQGVTWNFQATAYGANKVDITNTVGNFAWTSSPANVLTVDDIVGLPNNQIQVTAKDPGMTTIIASASGTTSTPFSYTTCLVKSIKLQIQGISGNSTTINAGGAKTLLADVVDTLGVSLTKPSLTWSTSNPEVATVSTAGVVTGRQEAGAANISASCTPPTCNIGVLPGMPIYSSGGIAANGQPAFGVITTHVTQTKPPVATAWTATTDCNNLFNCTSVMFAVTAGSTPIGSSVVLPYTPNSLMFNPGGTRAYLGSDMGLMFVDVSAQTLTVSTISSATTPCNVAVCGKPLAFSADGNKVVVSDTTTIPNQVYIFDAAHATNPPVDLLIDGATSAAFSPDQMKLFIVTNQGKLYVYSTVDAMLSVPVAAPAQGLAFSPDGSFAYIAGAPENEVSGVATCNLKDMGASSALASNPLLVFPLPGIEENVTSPDQSVIQQTLMALAPPNVQFLTATFTHSVLGQADQFTCDGADSQTTPTFSSFQAVVPPVNLGQGDFVPLYSRLTGDGSQFIVVAQNIPAVLVFDVASGTTSAFPLADGDVPRAATSTLDGTQIFVAACQTLADDDETPPYQRCIDGGSVHIVNVQQGGDIQQVPYTNVNTGDSMCSNLDAAHPCTPNLVAVRPQ